MNLPNLPTHPALNAFFSVRLTNQGKLIRTEATRVPRNQFSICCSNIPCVFLSIVGNVAKVNVIKDDMSTQKMYIAKSGNLFAHGDNKDHALREVSAKFFASMSFEAKKQEFIKLFKKDEVYPTRHFFEWHHHLTGSCESGRMMFVKAHGIDLDAGMNTITFLNLTKNEYNGKIIQEILNTL